MSNVIVQKANPAEKESLPVFAEIEKRLAETRQRAFDFFQRRGQEIGHELEDWLKAEREVFRFPQAELTEKDSAYQIQINLPGFDAKDIEVTATPSEVIVHANAEHAQHDQTANAGEETVVWSEFGAKDIYRRFELPAPVALDKVTAKLEKGILRIHAARAAESAPSTQIKVAAA